MDNSYKDVTDTAIFVKFKTLTLMTASWPGQPLLGPLPGNVALAVNPKSEYVKVKKEREIYILLKEKAELVEGKIVGALAGKDLVGMEYGGMFDDLSGVKEHKVIPWKDVTEEEGTGNCSYRSRLWFRGL